MTTAKSLIEKLGITHPDAEKVLGDALDAEYEAGLSEGREDGYYEGRSDGYESGYYEGKRVGGGYWA